MADEETVTVRSPSLSVFTANVPYDDSYLHDDRTGERFGSSGGIGTDASSGSRFTEENPPDRFVKALVYLVEALVYLFLHRPDAIENENDSSEARAKFLKQYEANERALLEQQERPIGLPKEEIERLSRTCIRLGFTKRDSFSVDQQKDLRDFLQVERAP
jgi:hypothetical protein